MPRAAAAGGAGRHLQPAGAGRERRATTIGTVNTAEFFLTATTSATFFSVLGWSAFTLHTLGILIGGIVAAPFGGILAKRVPTRHLMALVGGLLTLTSAWSIYSALAK